MLWCAVLCCGLLCCLGLPRPQGCQAHHPLPDLLVVPVIVLVIVLLLVVIFPPGPVVLLGLGPAAERAEDATEGTSLATALPSGAACSS